MGRKNIIDYVLKTPNNTNPAVLESLISKEIPDDGFCIVWDGNIKDKDYVNIERLGSYYKVSNLILDNNKLNESIAIFEAIAMDGERAYQPTIVNTVEYSGGKAVIGLTEDVPILFSGKKGEYIVDDINFTVLSDGTYFLRGAGEVIMHISVLMKPASTQ